MRGEWSTDHRVLGVGGLSAVSAAGSAIGGALIPGLGGRGC